MSKPGSTWKRGHFHYGEGGWPGPHRLPGPDELIDLDELPGDPGRPAAGPATPGGPGGQAEPPGPGELGPDPAPAPLRPEPGPGSSSGPRRTGGPKVSAAIRRDIAAKISLPLEAAGQIWRVRDPWCGGQFLEQRPGISDSLTAIACQSPYWVDFFTGPAGGFMAYVDLAAKVWPVIEMLIAHHITHSIGAEHGTGPGPGAPVDMSQYRA